MLQTLHVGILIVAAVVILFADHEAFGYLSGRTPLLDRRRTMVLHHVVWVLLAGMIATGLSMAVPVWDYLWPEPLFRLKLAFVGVLILNSLVINALMSHAFETPFRELSRARQLLLFASGAASTIGWLGAAGVGLYVFG